MYLTVKQAFEEQVKSNQLTLRQIVVLDVLINQAVPLDSLEISALAGHFDYADITQGLIELEKIGWVEQKLFTDSENQLKIYWKIRYDVSV